MEEVCIGGANAAIANRGLQLSTLVFRITFTSAVSLYASMFDDITSYLLEVEQKFDNRFIVGYKS